MGNRWEDYYRNTPHVGLQESTRFLSEFLNSRVLQNYIRRMTCTGKGITIKQFVKTRSLMLYYTSVSGKQKVFMSQILRHYLTFSFENCSEIVGE